MTVVTTLEALVALIVATPPAAGRPLIVGIVGAPGAGKSTIATELVELLAASALLPMDGYHLPQQRLVQLGRRDRMGAPDTFDVDALVATLRELRDAHPVVVAPAFDRTIEEPVAGAITIHTGVTSTVVVEGNYLLLERDGWEQLAPILDLSFFVELGHDLRVERLVARHEHFGKTASAARAWALGTDEANAVAVEATASRADHRIRLAL